MDAPTLPPELPAPVHEMRLSTTTQDKGTLVIEDTRLNLVWTWRFDAQGRLTALEQREGSKLLTSARFEPRATSSQEMVPADEAVCRRPELSPATQSSIQSLWNDLGNLDLEGLTKNVRFDGCESYAAQRLDENSRPLAFKGPELLRSELKHALFSGLTCLTKNTHPGQIGGLKATREAAAKVSAFLIPGYSRPIQISCVTPTQSTVRRDGQVSKISPGAIASAHTDCQNPGFPLVALSLARGNLQGWDAGPALFHELLHVAGYVHDSAVDLPYLATACCLEGDSNACLLLKSEAPFKSARYLTGWVHFISDTRGLPHHAAPAIEAAARAGATPSAILGASSDTLEFTRPAAMEKAQPGLALRLYLSARLALEGIPKADAPEATERLANAVGDHYGADGRDASVLRFADRVAKILGSPGTPAARSKGLEAAMPELQTLCRRFNAGEIQAVTRFFKDFASGVTPPVCGA